MLEQKKKKLLREQGKETDITIEEDGSATVNFDPKAVTPEGGEDHFENLAEFLGEEILDPLGSKCDNTKITKNHEEIGKRLIETV